MCECCGKSFSFIFVDKFSFFSWVIDILWAMTNYTKKFQSSKKSRLLFYFDKFINLFNKRIRSKWFFIGRRNGKNWFMINTFITTKYFLFQRLWPTLRQTSTNVVFGMQIASFLHDVAKKEKKNFLCDWNTAKKAIDKGNKIVGALFTTEHLFVTFSKTASYVLSFLMLFGAIIYFPGS